MKPEFIQEKKGMFAKLDQNQHKFQNHHYHLRQLQPPQPTLQHAYQVAGGGPGSKEEGDNCKNSELIVTPQPISAVGGTVNDGATIEISRRPRGRPPGSKNKPKPPVVITLDPGPSMCPYILELPCGVDLIGAVARFCRKRNTGLCILSGSGTVSDVTLRQPTTAPGPNIIFHGRFDILSISATVLNPNANFSLTSTPEDITIALAGPQGQVVGGAVVGPLTTAGAVYLIAATFNNPLHHRLPADEEEGNKNSGGGNEGGVLSSGGEESGGTAAAEELRGVPATYNCQMGSDVIWAAPAARQAPPPY